MSLLSQREVDMESHTSEMASQDSPLRRKFSEPIHANSNSTQTTPSPSPVSHRLICANCGQHFESSTEISASEALKKHIVAVHSSSAQLSTYDGATDPDDESQIYDDDYEQLDDEDMAVSNINGSLRAVDSDGDDNADGVEDELAEATEMYDDEKETNEVAGDEADVDGEVPEGESDVALSNQLHEFSREQDSASVEKRLHNFWNIHDVHKFSEDYDEEVSEMEETWTTVFSESKRGKKRDVPEIFERPNPYKKPMVGRGEFLEMTPLEDFLSQLRDPELRSSDELYAITENVAYALKVWQDEFLAIDKLQKLATRHNLKITSDPRKLERSQVFEDKKEAMLYGYKHDPKEDKIGHQNPFVQGGFKPTPAQYRKMVQKVGPVNPNPDGWRTITRFGIDHVPKFQNPPREDFVGKATRKRKAAELEAANKATDSDDAAATETPTPGEVDLDYANPSKRRARTRRQAAEVEQSTEFMNGRTFSGRGRGGRPRGRGAARGGSRAASEAPLAPLPGYGLPARSTPVADGSAQVRPGASQLVPIEPAPNGSPAIATAANPLLVAAQDESIDPAELARRQKIANSKNPKRTEAMLNHWARFNREGRVRNPKRSKAQIEADRAAEAAKKATEVPKPGIKQKKKSVSPSLPLPPMPPRPDAGLAPAPPPTLAPPPHLAPIPHAQHTPHTPHTQHTQPPQPPHPPHPPHPSHPPHPQQPPQLPPIAAARTSLAPYPPPHLEHRVVPPFPLGPRGPGPLHQPPPQPYRTPYPDYFNPYGAGGLPPPGHPRPA
ncbi:hypothetical protein BJY04DRAFT_189389 [Aspergillus karnatakaensis]|uniref:uncharacterized protein n=1 Tax=Aspergillus karnatakaensis TaxID=1810916 RepID=UPI003CCE3514